MAAFFFAMRPASSDTIKGFAWAVAGTLAATGVFWLFRASLDKGQASLLYLPVVIACALRFGFAPALAGAVLSFLCWDFFFLPPFYTFVVSDGRDWLSLVIFLIAAMTTARLASETRHQTEAAETREQETRTLYEASEVISGEVEAARLLPALAERIVQACRATRCVVLRGAGPGVLLPVATVSAVALPPETYRLIAQLSQAAAEHYQVIGFGAARHLWEKALEGMSTPGGHESKSSEIGVYVPLRAQGSLVGALHVGPRLDGRPFTEQDQRLILALANHAAVVIARQTLADEAAQASALREADTLKDALLSLVSHELRTPLAAIKAAASGLRSRGAVWPEDARAEAVETIDVEADRLTTLVSNLLDLSRLEAGAWNPSKDWCDLLEIVGTALDRLPIADADRVQVTSQVTSGDGLPLLRADYVQVALVLTNLLGNAAKYTPADSPIHVSVSFSGEATPPAIRVEVRDFGVGIVPGDEEAIFTRFYRSARHAGGTVHGTGLGLALCRAVIGAHGGHIWARNAPPGEPPGAIFSFWLPTE